MSLNIRHDQAFAHAHQLVALTTSRARSIVMATVFERAIGCANGDRKQFAHAVLYVETVPGAICEEGSYVTTGQSPPTS
jgi:hypothetical protein